MKRDVVSPLLTSDNVERTCCTRFTYTTQFFLSILPIKENLMANVRNTMDEEKLIECVRKHEFLFNLRHPKYMDAIKKDKAWKEISEQVKQPAAACKQRWQCLRDAYRRAMNKKKGRGGKYVKCWKYENEMSFLSPYLVERKLYDYPENTYNDEDSDNGDENNTIYSFVQDNADLEADVDESGDYDCSNSAQQQQNVNKSKTVKQMKAVDSESSVSSVLMSKLMELEPPKEDELDRFFLNIAETVKRFSPYNQALVKNKIFNLVSEMELQQLAPP